VAISALQESGPNKLVEPYRVQPWNGFEELIRFVLSHEGQQVVLDHARYLPRRAQQVQDARSARAVRATREPERFFRRHSA
jgi:hypothetical protein